MKTLTIAIKDTLLKFRDRNAILLMIAAPLLIALVMGLAFGGQGDGSSPISDIPIIIVNADDGDLADNFVEILTGIEVDTADGVTGLFAVETMSDKDAAIERVELGERRGVVFIPVDFSEKLETAFEAGDDEITRETAVVEVYTDPTANISPGIIRGVVSRIASGFSTVVIANIVTVDQVLGMTTDIPVAYINDDIGPVSEAADEAFSADNFEGLFVFHETTDLDAAQDLLDAGSIEAVIHVLPGFSDAVIQGGNVPAQVDVLAADNSLSAPIVADTAAAVAAGFGPESETAVSSAVLDNLGNLESILLAESGDFGETEGTRDRIAVSSSMVGESEEFNLLNYFVPSMAIFFLLFAVFDGTRSILEEEREGTLHRMMTTPTTRASILLGKIGGVFLAGILQFVVLVVISGLVFDVGWGGAPVAMALMVIGTVAAATALGAFVASFARDVNQANVLGTAITLVFAILGGNFIDYRALPAWLNPLSKATINRWAMEGFVELTLGGQGLAEVLPNIGVLFGMAAALFALSLLMFNRRFVK